MTSRKRSSKKNTSPQSSSGNPCTNEEIVPKEEFEVEQEEMEAYWGALCGSITPQPEVFYPAIPQDPRRSLILPFRAGPLPPILRPFRSFTESRAGLCFESRCMGINFLGVLILSYKLGMDLSPDDFEGLWSTRKTSIDYSHRMAPKRHMSIIQGHTSNAKGWFEHFFYVQINGASVEENCLPLFCGKWSFHHVSSPRPAGTCLLSAIFSATVRSFGFLHPRQDLECNGALPIARHLLTFTCIGYGRATP
ncbi:hypothetical protein DY000_02015138 [Brassica cretica]|uniref:PiggyBac transposable element-derived protein domain-containing protein n=1 Tax=Brassica cretica TaxID=69181 RepID=A0ABQ7D8H6_BRACR|nr:hypothetical protein DY000_02015138 [Brassica cretica]